VSYRYFINDQLITISALTGICLSSGIILKKSIFVIYFYELNIPYANLMYFIGILTGIIFIWRITKDFKPPEMFYINIDINPYLYANGFFIYLASINILINIIPLLLIPDFCYYYYGSYYKAKDFYYILYVIFLGAGFTQGTAVSFILSEKYKILTNKVSIIPLLMICIISFLVGTFWVN